jgi:tight adherence protein C
MYVLPALLAGMTVYLLILIMFHKRGAHHDTIRRRLGSVNNSGKMSFVLDEDINKPLSERIFKPILKSLANRFGQTRKMPYDPNSDQSKKISNLRKMLSQSGLGMTVSEYGIIRLLVIAGLAVLLSLVAFGLGADLSTVFFAAAVGLFLGYAGMRFVLKRSISKRKRLMEQQMPDVLDLLSVSVEAGLGFEQAINYITNTMEGPLIEELNVAYREMSMGRTRKDALILLGERCSIEELKSFVGAVVQAAQLGISIRNVLRSQAAAMRQARKAKVQEKAMKVSIKMLFPMLAFIFPVIFIILLGPAIVNVLKVLKG